MMKDTEDRMTEKSLERERDEIIEGTPHIRIPDNLAAHAAVDFFVFDLSLI